MILKIYGKKSTYSRNYSIHYVLFLSFKQYIHLNLIENTCLAGISGNKLHEQFNIFSSSPSFFRVVVFNLVSSNCFIWIQRRDHLGSWTLIFYAANVLSHLKILRKLFMSSLLDVRHVNTISSSLFFRWHH